MTAIADNKINVNKNLKFVLERVENLAAKGENAGNQHFLLFAQCFQHFQRHKSSFQEILFCHLQKLTAEQWRVQSKIRLQADLASHSMQNKPKKG